MYDSGDTQDDCISGGSSKLTRCHALRALSIVGTVSNAIAVCAIVGLQSHANDAWSGWWAAVPAILSTVSYLTICVMELVDAGNAYGRWCGQPPMPPPIESGHGWAFYLYLFSVLAVAGGFLLASIVSPMV